MNLKSLIPLSEARHRLPNNPVTGRPVSPTTLWRWCRVGCQVTDDAGNRRRLKLPTLRFGNRLFTSVAYAVGKKWFDRDGTSPELKRYYKHPR